MTSERFQQYIDEVRAKSRLDEILRGQGCKLVRQGRAWRCLSPLRKERTPSFDVYPDNTWYDYGTQEGGDIFAFVMKRDGCDFKTAAATLGDLASIERYWEHASFDDKDKFYQEVMARTEMHSTYSILTDAIDWYAHALPDFARKLYNEHYGLTDETIERLKLGWGHLGLWEYLHHEQHYSAEACLRTGLFVRKKSATHEFFANRLILPYWVHGQVRYAIGRRVEGHTSDEAWEKAKYKKLRTHSDKHSYISIHVSNDIFYNEDVLAKHVGELVITEGITDCIALDQHGFSALSPVTTSFRERDKPRLGRLLEKLKSHGSKIIICNDADVLADGKRPGEMGALKTAAFLHSLGHSVHIATLPRPEGSQKLDVCEHLRDHGQEAMRRVLDEAKPYLDYLIDGVPVDAEPAKKSTLLEPVIAAIATRPPIEREALLRHVSLRFGIKLSTLEAMAREVTPEAVAADETKPAVKKDFLGGHLRGEVFEDLDETGSFVYMARAKNGASEQVSTFTLTARKRVLQEGREVLLCDAATVSGKTFPNLLLHPEAWESRRAFFKTFPTVDMAFTGSDENVQGVRALLSQEQVPVLEGTSKIGYFASSKGPRWTWLGGCIDSSGIQADPDVICTSTATSFSQMLRYVDTPSADTRHLASRVYPTLFGLNQPEVILPLIAWFHAAALRPIIVQYLGSFPVLMVYGSAGSGKTTIIQRVFWPLLGFDQASVYPCTSSEFAMNYGLQKTTSIPVVFDEFKPADMEKRQVSSIKRLVRASYGETVEEKGRRDQLVNSYSLTAPLVIIGESPLDGDVSLLERQIVINPQRDGISGMTVAAKGHRAAFALVQSLPLYQLAVPYIKWLLVQDVNAALFRSARTEAQQVIDSISEEGAFGERVQKNIATFLLGLRLFTLWCAHLGIDATFDPALVVRTVRALLCETGMGAVVDENGIESIVPVAAKDAFDIFLEDLSALAHVGDLVEGVHYAYVEEQLCLHLDSCYNVYLEKRAQRHQPDMTNGMSALRRTVSEKHRRGEYVLSVGKQVPLSGSLPGMTDNQRRVRCIVVNPRRVPEALQFMPFPCRYPRTHGGHRVGDN